MHAYVHQSQMRLYCARRKLCQSMLSQQASLTVLLRMDCDIPLMLQSSQSCKLVLSGHTVCPAVTHSYILFTYWVAVMHQHWVQHVETDSHMSLMQNTLLW